MKLVLLNVKTMAFEICYFYAKGHIFSERTNIKESLGPQF